jgi:4-hydroxybenzoate polyprenyltransferase
VYACQDKADDVKAGVRSTAILFGTWIRQLLTLFGMTFAATLLIAGYINSQHLIFFLIATGGAFIHLIWQYVTVNLDDPRSCKGKYDSMIPL